MSGFYPSSVEELKKALNQLKQIDKLSCFIETDNDFFGEASITSISFAINNDGISFACTSEITKEILRDFYESYNGKIMYYGLSDLRPLIYNLYMSDYYDYSGMNKGIDILTKSFDDIKLITYLATNSCGGNYLAFKQQCKANNGLDSAIGIWNIYNKHYQVMIEDKQQELYEGLFKESAIQILQMELTGMPIDMEKSIKVSNRLNRISKKYTNFLNAKLVDLRINKININSPAQLQELLHAQFRLPILDRTKTGQPSTSTKSLEKLINHCTKKNHHMILRCLIKLSQVNTVLTTIIPKILDSTKMSDGNYRLYGSFNLGGTVSGRLSSSNPNLHGIPSESTYAKPIKSCFKSSKGKIFGGADYHALEDVVNSLLTKDPNKLKIHEQGYDSHMLKTVCYWPSQFTNVKRGIEGENYYSLDGEYMHSNDMFRTDYGTNLTIEELYQFDLGDYHNIKPINYVDYDVYQINNLKSTHSKLRSISKVVTFPLTYFGTSKTLQESCGLSVEEADEIYKNYHDMYVVSDEWINKETFEVSKKGYATTAFGLRIRTPELANVVWDSSYVSQKAKAEARTVGNAISGQSYGLLTNRAANEFRQRVKDSVYRNDIHIIALIHDAIYIEWTDILDITEWVNNNLIECMVWNDLPELKHEIVKLSADLDIFYPSWSNPITIKYQMSQSEIIKQILPYL